MSKKKATAAETATIQERRLILTATSREDIFAQFESLKASLPEGSSITAGAIGQSAIAQEFTLQVDIVEPVKTEENNG